MLIAAVVGLVLLQTSAAPAFSIFGVGPNLLLVVLCCWLVVRGADDGFILVPLAGIGVGLLSFQGMAESVAALAPIVIGAALWTQFRHVHPFAWALALIAAATILHFLALAVAVQLETTGINWLEALRDVLLPTVLLNVILGVVIYWLIRLPSRRPLSARA